jgi:dTDP-4-amino-4,6-dideoxygalactose transaminase
MSRESLGDELMVALPAYACPDIGTAVIGADAGVLLYDVDPDTLEPDLASLRRAVRSGATHVVAVHLFGRLVDVGAIAEVAGEMGAVVIEDAAQHAGGTREGVRGGALADWSVLSFGRGKGLNAGGGGALLRRASEASGPPALASDASWRPLIVSAAVEWMSHPALYWIPAGIPALALGETRYHAPAPPAGIGLAQAALLPHTLDAEPRVLSARRALATHYRAVLAERPGLLLTPPPRSVSDGALREPVRLSPADAAPLARLGVARSYPRTLADYPAIAARVRNPAEPLPGATALATHLHTLPTHHHVTLRDRDRLIAALRTTHY